MLPLGFCFRGGLVVFWLISSAHAEMSGETYKDEDRGQPMIKYLSKLQIYTWEVFPDMAIFDWFIKLSDKERQGSILYLISNLYQVFNLFFDVFCVFSSIIESNSINEA